MKRIIEKSFDVSLTLHIKVKGDKAKAASIIETASGVKELTDIDDEGNDIYSFTVLLSGETDAVRDSIMSECIKNGISILEIYADKPDLEKVFIELINRPAKKSGLEELLAETPAVPEASSDKKED